MPIHFQPIPQELPIAIESIGCDWQQHHIHRPNGYPFYHWLQTQSGSGRFRIGGEELVLAAGEGILIPPFVPHDYQPVSQWVTSFVSFNGLLEADFPKIIGTSRSMQTDEYTAAKLLNWIKIVMAQIENQEIDPYQLSGECYQLFLAFSRNQTNLQPTHPLYQQYVKPVMQQIETFYALDLKVEDLAARRFISPQYLTRLFKRFTGGTTQDYLLEQRLRKAKELLTTQREQSISQIASAVGFASQSYFSELFKARNQMTPTAFRKLH